MPYKDISELPKYVRKYSKVVQRQFMHVFNTVFKNTNSEVRAFRAANSVLKKRFRGKEQNWNKNNNDYIQHLIDVFLGNLQG